MAALVVFADKFTVKESIRFDGAQSEGKVYDRRKNQELDRDKTGYKQDGCGDGKAV